MKTEIVQNEVREKLFRQLMISLAVSCFHHSVMAVEAETDQPLPPQQAASSMEVPEGFQVTLFAGEPDVQQPIGFCIDDRGRLWVAEAYNYPHHGTKPGDRILIFEDQDGDGKFDKRTVFYDKLNYVTGIEVGFGGVWVVSPPSLFFIPDKNKDDQPDQEPRVLLDGFGNHANSHNLANGLAWGPDGWLYGTHGRTNWSMLGMPGTPKEQRIRFDGGVYRYHPVRHIWEPFADGTTNPWGIDWNDYGDAFICNCVNPHVFQVIQGAHYEPWRNRKSSQFAYERIPTIADHLHYFGGRNVRDGHGTEEMDLLGGGHAHSGTLIYLGDNWPARYRNSLLTNNIHGRRINNDFIRRSGSGYIASHGADLMRAKDPWYMGVTLRTGPDGSVFASDWSDTGECHSTKNTRRHTGRIYKISYGRPAPFQSDLSKLSDLELVDLQWHSNDWMVRHARRLLHERAVAGHKMTIVHRQLQGQFAVRESVPQKLRALWALKVVGGLTEDWLIELLRYPSEYIQSWAIRFLCEDKQPSAKSVKVLERLARETDSPYVRLQLAVILQRIDPADRWRIAESLVAHSEDAEDKNLPLMIWYGIEPLHKFDLQRFMELLTKSRISLLRRHIARRIVSDSTIQRGIEFMLTTVSKLRDEDAKTDVLEGALIGLRGQRKVNMPDVWPRLQADLLESSNEELKDIVLQLAVAFNDPNALRAMKQIAIDKNEPVVVRDRAINSLVEKDVDGLESLLLRLLEDKNIQATVLRGLAHFESSEISSRILKQYRTMDPASRSEAIQTLASRPKWALAMLDEMEKGTIDRAELNAFTARQLTNLENQEVTRRTQRIWGKVRKSSAEKRKRIQDYKQRLTPHYLDHANLESGRKQFQAQCGKCHQMFGVGEKIGPDLTGSQRQNLDYLLENIIDPSASLAAAYQMQIFETARGRVITGLVVQEDENSVTIQTLHEKIVVPIKDIAQRSKSELSLMPDGILNTMSSGQIRDLFGYLRSPRQVELTSE